MIYKKYYYLKILNTFTQNIASMGKYYKYIFTGIILSISQFINAQQKIVYVSPEVSIQNDAISNNGTSIDMPLKTIKNALSKFESTDSGIIFLLQGTYRRMPLQLKTKTTSPYKPMIMPM